MTPLDNHSDTLSNTGAVNWLREFGWAALAIATSAIAVIPDLVTLPEPDSAIVLDRATYAPDKGASSEVALPHAIYPELSNIPSR